MSILGLWAGIEAAASSSAGALGFLIAWWIPVVVFGVPGLIFLVIGYKLIGRREEIRKEVMYMRQPSSKTCPKCGKAVPSDARLCPYCGHKF